MKFTTFLSALLLATASIAAPVDLISDLVVSPHITAPEEAVSWPMGSTQVVKWETDSIPEAQRNDKGMILLGYAGDGESEHLDISSYPFFFFVLLAQDADDVALITEHPLAKGFRISAGQATVKMPTNVPARDDYFVVLFGDSGNTSANFKITAVNSTYGDN
ncbi:uncharacterized protein LACBIDRAFT_322658 [Laccaria bicolor S238N-H82]|uniref:Predicted protein n=1 Tax=Laccaria bicolor (strain S238N-H82 / ATCC MYA-4686) TaxID=486041 RepID=B0CX31_LACBS|nr:uncharacterized protein LACBIDRAFT_322658 [Laccaria bicolor S238N-H82]EDR13181.1 predicted protein [Laccaria bicolor S238N-H82]|eukprot:XP_001875679.1 predicted protein [Laccaria bicolor S238N-H82]